MTWLAAEEYDCDPPVVRVDRFAADDGRGKDWEYRVDIDGAAPCLEEYVPEWEANKHVRRAHAEALARRRREAYLAEHGPRLAAERAERERRSTTGA